MQELVVVDLTGDDNHIETLSKSSKLLSSSPSLGGRV